MKTRRNAPAADIPRPPEGEVWIAIKGQRDECGYVQFTAYWPADNYWRGGDGVAAQVFNADDCIHATEWAKRGRTVRYINECQELGE